MRARPISLRDTVALLRELDPVAPHAPQPRRSRTARVAGFAAGTAAVCALFTSVMTGNGSPPTLVEAAYAALASPDRIIHLQLHSRFHLPPDEPTSTEIWTRAGGKQLRVVYAGGQHEFVRDEDRRYAAGFVRHRNLVTVYKDHEMFAARAPDELTFGGPEGAARVAEQLPALLRRARDGDPSVRRLPDAQLAGRMAARLEITSSIRFVDDVPSDGRVDQADLRPGEAKTVVWIDHETHLPRRIERIAPSGRPETTTDVVARALPVDAGTEQLLDMAPHPHARRIVAGRSDEPRRQQRRSSRAGER